MKGTKMFLNMTLYYIMWLFISHLSLILKIELISHKMTLYRVNVTISEFISHNMTHNVILYLSVATLFPKIVNLYLTVWLCHIMWLYISQLSFISFQSLSHNCHFTFFLNWKWASMCDIYYSGKLFTMVCDGPVLAFKPQSIPGLKHLFCHVKN